MRLSAARLLVPAATALLVVCLATPDARRLVQRLGADRAAVRDAAAAELRTLGETAIPALVDGVRSDDAAIRRRARVLLAVARDTDGTHSRRATAEAAVRAAGGTPARGSDVDTLLLNLGDAGAEAVVDAVERTAERRLVPADAVAAVGRHASTESLSRLARLLREDRVVVSGALRAARAVEGRDDVPLLDADGAADLAAVLAETWHPGRRAAAALLLADAAPEGRVTLAARLAGDHQTGVRCEAARALGRAGVAGIAGVATLDRLAADDNATVRVAALEALATLPGRPRPAPAVRNLAHADPAVRAAAATLLGTNALPEHVPLLERAASDAAPRVRAAAESALRRLATTR